MAQLPQAADYGGRVGLRSNRIDIPGQGELAVADSLANAASVFTNMAIEHKQKDDALSYSNAKNEYLISDIQEREKLKDDQDFATQDDRYRAAMKVHYARLFPTVKSQRDRGLFDAEARLMNERGAVAVGDNARTKEIDWNIGNFRRNAVDAQGVIMAASDAQTAQDAMFGVLEQGAALRARGYLKETEYQAEMQGFVTQTAEKRLIAMDPKEREILLERSITMAKTRGEPITQEQIRNGEGSGSIADFIPLDERVAMLETTRKGNQHDDTMREAWGVFDEVTAVNREPSKVQAALAAASKGMDPDVRTAVNTLGVQYRQNYSANKGLEQQTVMDEATAFMNDDKNPEDMLGDRWGLLGNSQQQAIKQDWINRLQGDGFGDIDTMYTAPSEDDHSIGPDGEILLGENGPKPSYAYWMSVPRAERVNINLQTSPWRTAFTKEGHTDLVKAQEIYRKENASVTKVTESPGLTPMQRVNSALVTMEIIPANERSEDDQRKYWSAVRALDKAIRNAEGVKGSKLLAEEEALIWTQMLEDKAFTDNFYSARWWPGGPDTAESDKKLIVTMDPATLNKTREPLAGSITSVGGQTMPVRVKLEKMGADIGITDIAERDLERANWALINLLGTDGTRYNIYTITPEQMLDVDREVERRLGGT